MHFSGEKLIYFHNSSTCQDFPFDPNGYLFVSKTKACVIKLDYLVQPIYFKTGCILQDYTIPDVKETVSNSDFPHTFQACGIQYCSY